MMTSYLLTNLPRQSMKGPSRRGSQRELDRLRPLHLLRGVEEFNREDTARFVIIENQAVADFIAFRDFARSKDDRKCVGFFVVNDFHGCFQYFAILLVL